MGTAFSYSLTSSIILACLYIAYRWTMADKKQFTLNRITVHAIYLVSIFALPVYEYATGMMPSMPDNTGLANVGSVLNDTATGMTADTAAPEWINVLIWIYTAGTGFAAIRFIYSLMRIRYIIKSGTKVKTIQGYDLIVINSEGIAPFSCFNYMAVPSKDYLRHDESLFRHELAHLRNRHWIDLFAANIVAIFQWYNPAAWLLIEELKTIHEYQADDSVIRSGCDIREYQYMLIEKAVGDRLPSPANSLNHRKLKKRVTMMYKTKPRTTLRAASLATIPALIAGIAIINIPAVASVISETKQASLAMNPEPAGANFLSAGKITDSAPNPETYDSRPDSDNLTDEEVFDAVEQTAEFPGGTGALMQFLNANIKYPENAVKNKIQGRVIVRFIISKDGKVINPIVIRGIDPDLDKEALRVVRLMPNWIPAKNNGKPVASRYNIPMTFKLQ